MRENNTASLDSYLMINGHIIQSVSINNKVLNDLDTITTKQLNKDPINLDSFNLKKLVDILPSDVKTISTLDGSCRFHINFYKNLASYLAEVK